MAATNVQVQAFSDERMRPNCEAVRTLALKLTDMIACIDDVYANLTSSPTWTDNRTQVAHVMTPQDMLALNAYFHNVLTAITGDANYPVALKCCVSLVQG